ncbi:unnamed protein product [Enterobius vermicularis]|uniref:Uncharacterized protein n=1 Tax=Enterobius vermicularis TaxID=51028 RepID=A0A0N4VP06_ENTVE|nr:unnamed protein product [Enterobius vermicularis]
MQTTKRNEVPAVVMTKPPAVSDFASTLTNVIATASSQHSEAIEEPVRAGFDAEVLWRGPRLSLRHYRNEEHKSRRFSLTEVILGPSNRFGTSLPTHRTITEGAESFFGRVRKQSVTEDERFKEILRRQKEDTTLKPF